MTLIADEISKKFDDHWVLKNVSIDVQPGDSIALIGPNGSGKSTLLSALSGILSVDSGELTIDGRELSGFSRRNAARQVSFLPQSGSYSFSMTVRAFVALGFYTELSRFGGLDSEQSGRLQTAITTFELDALSERMLHTLSGGELQRARLARIATSLSPFLLLDEPTAALDPKYAAMAIDFVTKSSDEERGIMVSLHDFSLVEKFDRFVLLSDGEVFASGPAGELSADDVSKVYEVAARKLEDDGRIAWSFG